VVVTFFVIPCVASAFSSPAVAQINTSERVSLCKASQLSAKQDLRESDEVDGGVGHHAMTVEIQNHSSSACVVRGIPALTLLDAAKRSLPAAVCSNCADYLFGSQAVKGILVKPNRSAYLLIGYNINDGAGPCRRAVTLRLLITGEREPLKISVVQGRDAMRSCGAVDITPFLEEPPVNGFLPGRT
jgi:hypothetical protein